MPYPPAGKHERLLFIELQTVDSTNNYALSRVYAGLAQHGTAVFSHEQVAGKGQRGKSWISNKGENVALSIVLETTALPVPQQFSVSICIAVACQQVLQKYLGDDTKIKWPNDLYWQDRKAGGILIENNVAGNTWKWAIAGIGLNVNQTSFPEGLRNPVSFKQITGEEFIAIDLAREIANSVLHEFDQLIKGNSRSQAEYYHQHLYRMGQQVKLKSGPRIFEATIKEVTANGKLKVMHAFEEEFEVGQVEWLNS